MRGVTKGQGWSEAQFPVYERLPTAWHSKENELYLRGEMIRGLAVGRAVFRFRGNSTFLNIPPPRRSKKP